MTVENRAIPSTRPFPGGPPRAAFWRVVAKIVTPFTISSEEYEALETPPGKPRAEPCE
jgi:hypothetical protein